MRGGARHSRVKLGTVVGAYLAWNRPARLFGGAPALATARARPESKEAVAERQIRRGSVRKRRKKSGTYRVVRAVIRANVPSVIGPRRANRKTNITPFVQPKALLQTRVRTKTPRVAVVVTRLWLAGNVLLVYHALE